MAKTSKHIPREINRKSVSLLDIKTWKATEFRTFLLYTGPCLLQCFVDPSIYQNFLLLHCSITILISQYHLQYFSPSFSSRLLKAFVDHSKEIHGMQFLVYNVHLLIHLASDVENFGPLDTFFAFPFESFLNQLKKLVRSPNKPLQQICRRLAEISLAEKCPDKQAYYSPSFLNVNHEGPYLLDHNISPASF